MPAKIITCKPHMPNLTLLGRSTPPQTWGVTAERLAGKNVKNTLKP